MSAKNSKAKRQKAHARRRARERYGLSLKQHEYHELCRRIQENIDCKFLYRQSNRVSLFALKWGGEWLPVVYDKQRHTVVTVLPQEALEPYLASL
jgi:hypothetical protein